MKRLFVCLAPLALAVAPALATPPGSGLTVPPLERVLWDAPTPGVVHAVAPAYKAQFHAGGATYVPFLGSHAPRNRPVALRLEQISRGGRLVDFDRYAEPWREGERVSFERGAVTEFYELAPRTLEQLFRFERLPAGQGDLVLRVALEAEVALSERSHGFELAFPEGRVHYGRATVFDASGRSASAPTRRVPGGVEIRVSESFLVGARGAVTIDPIVSTFDVASGSGTTINPDAAYEVIGGVWGIAYLRRFSQTDFDVYLLLAEADGTPIQTLTIEIGTLEVSAACVAGNVALRQFLVAYASPAGITWRRVHSLTHILSLPVGILLQGVESIDAGGDPDPSGPGNFLLVADAERPNGARDAYRVHVRSDDGWALEDLFPSTSSSAITSDARVSPSCGAGSQRAWTITHRSSELGMDTLYTTHVRPDGGLQAPETSFTTGHARCSPVASSPLDGSDPRLYLVAYEDRAASVPRIVVALRRGTSTVQTTPLHILEGTGVSTPQSTPSIDSDGSNFVVVYREEAGIGFSIVLTTLSIEGGLLATESRVAVDSGFAVSPPSVASQRSGGGPASILATVFSENSDAHGVLYRTPGVGVPYCSAAPNSASAGGAGLSARGSRSLTSAQGLRLFVDGCPANKSGLFFFGFQPTNQLFGEGRRCVGGLTRRIQPVVQTGASGRASLQLSPTANYYAALSAGAPGVYYQFWYRDPNADTNGDGSAQGFNLSQGLWLEHTP